MNLIFRWKIKEIWVKNLLACIYLVLDIVEKFHDKIEIDIPQSFDIKIVERDMIVYLRLLIISCVNIFEHSFFIQTTFNNYTLEHDSSSSPVFNKQQ